MLNLNVAEVGPGVCLSISHADEEDVVEGVHAIDLRQQLVYKGIMYACVQFETQGLRQTRCARTSL